MTPTDPIRQLFNSLTADLIRRWVQERKVEDLHLDFKVVAGQDGLAPSDKENLAKALSGFANSDGGLIVWGVYATRGSDDVDCAQELRPVRNVRRAVTELNHLLHDAVSPLVDGVENRLVELDGEDGLIVTIIPRSESAPHMARLQEYRYFKRSGDSFRRLEHFDLEDMFGRRPKPRLELLVDQRIGSRGSGSGGRDVSIELIIGIRNAGRGIARFPSLSLDVNPPYRLSQYGLDGSWNIGLPRAVPRNDAREPVVFAGGADHVVHAQSSLDVTRVSIRVHESDTSLSDLAISYRIACDGIAPFDGAHVISGVDILAAARQVLGSES